MAVLIGLWGEAFGKKFFFSKLSGTCERMKKTKGTHVF